MARCRRRRRRECAFGGRPELRLAYGTRARPLRTPPPPPDAPACKGSGCLVCRRWAHLLRQGDPVACRRWARLHPNYFSVHRPFWDSLNEEDEQKMKGKQPAKRSTKRKARGMGPQVLVDNPKRIPGNIYRTWMKDPSSLVSIRRRVSSKINFIRTTKIGDLMNLPPVALMSYSENSTELYYPKQLMQLWKKLTEAKSLKPSSSGDKPSPSSQEQQPRNLSSQVVQELVFEPLQEFQKEMGAQPMDTNRIEKNKGNKGGELEKIFDFYRESSYAATGSHGLNPRSASSSGGSRSGDSCWCAVLHPDHRHVQCVALPQPSP